MGQAVLYHPKKNHPWRRYNKRDEVDGEQKKEVILKENKVIHEFFRDIVQEWDTYKIDTKDSLSYESRSLKYMSDVDIANWIVDFLQRNIIKSSQEDYA